MRKNSLMSKFVVLVLSIGMIATSSVVSFAGSAAPAKAKIKSAKALSTSEIQIKWNKINKNCDGYQLARNGEVIKTFTSKKTVSYTDTGLAQLTTYKYKVRAYNKVNGKKVYGKYSAVKTVTTLSGSTGWPEGGEEGFIPVDGGRVFYHLYGKDKTGTPLIFMHGGPGGTGNCFFKQLALAENRPVVIYNQLGSAGSDFADEITTAEEAQKYLTIEHYVDEAQTVVDYLGFDEFVLVGRSWGTMLAVEYAAAKQPEGLKGIVLDGPFLNVDTWCEDAQRLIQSLPEMDVCGVKMDGKGMWKVVQECEASGAFYDDERYSVINDIYSSYFNSRFENAGCNDGTPSDSAVTQHRVSGVSVYNYMWGPSEFSCTGTLKGHDSTNLLSKINVPILYICGQYDSGSPEAAQKYFAKTNVGEITMLPGCAHNASRERPAEFNTAIEAFVNRLAK